jgi:hypothetical protein
MLIHRRVALGLAGLAVPLAGCAAGMTHAPGAHQPSVATLVRDAQAAFASASSVRISGIVNYGGRALSLDVGMFRSGDLSGTITLGQLTEKVVVSGANKYVFASQEFFRYLEKTQHVPASACAVVCGKYIKEPAGTATSKFSLTALARLFEKDVPVTASVPSIKVVRFHGQPAYELTHNGQSAFIAEHGTHYLLGLSDPAKHELARFNDWNSVPPVIVPPASQVFSRG